MNGFFINHSERQMHEKMMQSIELGAMAALTIAAIAGTLFLMMGGA